MKQNLRNVILILGLPIIFFSCKNLPDPTITLLRVSFSEDFSILADSAISPSDSAVFAAIKSFDPNNNSDFFSNRSKFSGLEIEKLEYLVKDIAAQTADSLIEARFELLNPSTNQFETLAEDFNRKLIVGQRIGINLNPSGKASLIKILTSASPHFEIRIKGKMDKRPIHLILAPEIQLSIKTKI